MRYCFRGERQLVYLNSDSTNFYVSVASQDSILIPLSMLENQVLLVEGADISNE